jgi:hypothetical protein
MSPATHSVSKQLAQQGFAIVPEVLSPETVDKLVAQIVGLVSTQVISVSEGDFLHPSCTPEPKFRGPMGARFRRVRFELSTLYIPWRESIHLNCIAGKPCVAMEKRLANT